MDCYGVVLYTTTLHSWVKWQKPAKNLIEKSAKLTHHTYACSSLTNLEYEEYAINGNGRSNQSKICLEKFEKSHKVNLFLACFIHLEPQCKVLSSKPRFCSGARFPQAEENFPLHLTK